MIVKENGVSVATIKGGWNQAGNGLVYGYGVRDPYHFNTVEGVDHAKLADYNEAELKADPYKYYPDHLPMRNTHEDINIPTCFETNLDTDSILNGQVQAQVEGWEKLGHPHIKGRVYGNEDINMCLTKPDYLKDYKLSLDIVNDEIDTPMPSQEEMWDAGTEYVYGYEKQAGDPKLLSARKKLLLKNPQSYMFHGKGNVTSGRKGGWNWDYVLNRPKDYIAISK
jgi:hypothetical protein